MSTSDEFDHAWRAYVGSDGRTVRTRLEACLHAATTYEQAKQVFYACLNDGLATIPLRSPALGKMISVAATPEQLEMVIKLAGPKRNAGSSGYPRRLADARQRLKELCA